MSIQDQFAAKVEAYLTRTGMTATNFGIQVMADPGFVPELRDGRSPLARTMDKVEEFMRRYPDGYTARVAEAS